MNDLYDVLGVERNANRDEIKRAYRKSAMKYHPDRNPGNKQAEKNFKEAAEAYSVLGDEGKRARYDQFGHAGVGLDDGTSGPQGYGGIHMSMDDIFSQFGDIFGGQNPFSDIFGGSRRGGRQVRRKAKDLRISLTLTYREILEGIEKQIKIKRNEICNRCSGNRAEHGTDPATCQHCRGTGQVRQVTQSLFGQSISVTECPICQGEGEIIEKPCRECGGRGITKKTVTISINIPKGVASGNYMSLEGQGHKGWKGISPGDLIVFFEEENHAVLVRNGHNVLLEAKIPFSMAVLGHTITVPTIEGHANLKVPPGIQSGQVLRMKGKGFTKLRSNQRGNQLIKIQVVTPKDLSKKSRALVKEFAESESEKKIKYGKVKIE